MIIDAVAIGASAMLDFNGILMWVGLAAAVARVAIWLSLDRPRRYPRD
jgi:hypothetical protein